MSDETIATDNPFNPAHVQMLRWLAGLLIPASSEYGVPGADDERMFNEILIAARRQADVLKNGLDGVESLAQDEMGQPFIELEAEKAVTLVERVRETDPAFVGAFVTATLEVYYRQPEVMQSLKMDVRPPFPSGYDVPDGDWSILEPVRARGEIWRRIE